MGKLQNITLATAISILGLNTVKITNADASIITSNSKLMSLRKGKAIAAESASKKSVSISSITKVSHYEVAQKPNAASTKDELLESEKEILDALQKRQQVVDTLKDNIQGLEEKIPNKIQGLEEKIPNEIEDSVGTFDSVVISQPLLFKLITIGLPAMILVIAISSPLTKGLIGVFTSNFQQKFGKPSIPERSLNLHYNAFREISSIGKNVEKINDDKFTNEEFKLLIQIKVDIIKEIEGYKELNYRVELLKAAVITQKSFLKLEATELRYRSRKQQEFYQYVADNLEEDIDKEVFAKKIKKKQTEILPLINTEEGREAINSYAQEIDIISKHELGLKLLALFKQYDLADFSLIKEISDLIEGLQGQDLLTPKCLLLSVKEYYDVFEKIAPILSISKEESSPPTYARILQVIGLENRHGKAYQQFRELIRLLHKWENLYETVVMVREQYSPQEYQTPPEFKEDIPGLTIYQKYAQYIADLS